MARNIRWTNDKYILAIRGGVLPGLRSIARGFTAADGYSLRNVKGWSSYKKRKVREYYERVRRLESQERIIVRPRSQKNLESLIAAFHGDIPSDDFKVAFVPFVQSISSNGKKGAAPKIRYLKSGIAISGGSYERLFIPFDVENLVLNPELEIKRVLKAMPDARLFFVQVGEFQTLNGMGPRVLTEQIVKYMHLYDGVKQLPKSSGNYGDAPSVHHWQRWLNGVVGFVFSKKIDVSVMQRRISEGMQKAKKRRAKQDAMMKSKRRR